MPHYIKISIYDANKLENFRDLVYWIKQEGNKKRLKELYNMWMDYDNDDNDRFFSIDMKNPITKKQLNILVKSNVMKNYKIFDCKLKKSIIVTDNDTMDDNIDDTITLLESLQYHEDDFFIPHNNTK